MIKPTVPSLDADHVVLTGRRRVGKDFVAEKNGYEIYGFADPMYELAEHFVGSSDKEKPGVLDFIYKVGAWGRGEVNEDYPLTPERRRVTKDIRENGARRTNIGSARQWESFGKQEDLWIGLLEERIKRSRAHDVAVTNARFPNELSRILDLEGFEHHHVMCSEEIRKERLGDEEYHGPSDDPQNLPVTEQMAAWFDRFAERSPSVIMEKFRQHGSSGTEYDDAPYPVGDQQLVGTVNKTVARDVAGGTSLVWNDPGTPPPSELREPNEVDVDFPSGIATTTTSFSTAPNENGN